MSERWTRLALGFCAVVLVWASSNINWGGTHWRTVMQADAKGYHAYLPALLLYQDPNMGFFDAIEGDKYYSPNRYYDYRIAIAGRIIDRYYMGTAFAQLPFFIGAHAIAPFTDHEADGFSKPYVIATNLAAIAWVLLGLWCLARLLADFGIDDRWRAFTIVAFAFGTNLFYYTVVAPGMSHAYGFGASTAFFLLASRWGTSRRPWHLPAMGALLGLIILIRPVNALVVLALPLFWQRPLDALRAIIRRPMVLAAAAVLVLAIPALQFLYYKAATGQWFVYSYGDERFNWSDPHFLDMLFSYRKGLFVYTPLLLCALAGLRFWWRGSRRQVMWWVLFLALLTWVLGSWWNWWYGGSFGSRVYVEYLALFAIPFALALQHLKRAGRTAMLIAAVILVAFCQVQTYQARYYVIHWEDMDREKYWESVRRIPELR